MLGLSGFVVVRKTEHRTKSILDMHELIHGGIHQQFFTANKTMAPLQQFVFLSQSKTRMRKDEWVKE
jgi:hypothetical protein